MKLSTHQRFLIQKISPMLRPHRRHPMTDFETANARCRELRDAYWKAESALMDARAALTIAERDRRAAFNKEIEAARDRRDASTPGEPK